MKLATKLLLPLALAGTLLSGNAIAEAPPAATHCNCGKTSDPNNPFNDYALLKKDRIAGLQPDIIAKLQNSPAKGAAQPLQSGTSSNTLQSGTQSTTLQTGTQSTTLQTGTQSTMLQTGTQSTMLQTGTQSTTLQSGTESAMIQGQVEHQGGPINILIIIDSSYSMKEKLAGGVEKMEAAKQVLQNALARIPSDVNLGLRVFGQGFMNDPYYDCQQSALLVPIGKGNRRSIIERVRQLHPFGLTPLAYSLQQAERDFRGTEGTKHIILITDGAETCGGNPCAFVARLNQIGIKMRVDVVGLSMRRDKEGRDQLNCIATASGGKYYDANNAEELIDSVSRSVDTALSGRIITRLKQPASNTETPLDKQILGPMLGH